ncbi:MAG TPA: uroporphyrinogen decarboxylase family protein, partial [Anaerolineae bacterium]
YEFDAPLFRHWVDVVGDDGIMMCHVTQSPLKALHWLAGPANASLFISDHPAEMAELARIHEDKALRLVAHLVDEPAAEIFFSGDNLDSAFYSPRFYADYCASFYRRCADLAHSRGKYFVVHACGRSKKLLPQVGASAVDCLEGITPRPQGDVELADVRALTGRARFVVNGGMDAPRLTVEEDPETAIHQYTHDLFAGMGDRRSFIFASSCMTPVPTPWQNLIYFRDAARAYGELPGADH